MSVKNEELSKFKSELVTNPNDTILKIQQEESKSVLDEIGALYSLPADETPTIATVQDVSKLDDQPFFKEAVNGDKLVVYEKSGLAILYRPGEKKLIKVGPLNIKNDTPAESDNQ